MDKLKKSELINKCHELRHSCEEWKEYYYGLMKRRDYWHSIHSKRDDEYELKLTNKDNKYEQELTNKEDDKDQKYQKEISKLNQNHEKVIDDYRCELKKATARIVELEILCEYKEFQESKRKSKDDYSDVEQPNKRARSEIQR